MTIRKINNRVADTTIIRVCDEWDSDIGIYRYTISPPRGVRIRDGILSVYRIERKYLDRTASLNIQSDYNPHGWELVAEVEI